MERAFLMNFGRIKFKSSKQMTLSRSFPHSREKDKEKQIRWAKNSFSFNLTGHTHTSLPNSTHFFRLASIQMTNKTAV